MGKAPPSSQFKPADVTPGMLAELREIAAFLFEREGFEECFAVRKGFTKMDLTKAVRKLEKPEDLILGAPAVESITFVKKNGDYPGSLVIYKDRMMFHSTAAYRLSGGMTSVEKDKELAGLKGGVVEKARSKALMFEGELEKFSLTRLAAPNKLDVINFMQDVKSALFGLSLKAF